MTESIEEFLKRGGKITQVESGKSGLNMAGTYKEKIKRSDQARIKNKGVPITIKRRD